MDASEDPSLAGGQDTEPEISVDDVLNAIEMARKRSFDVEELAAELRDALQQVEHLQHAVETRTVIGQATGLLMHARGLSADDAFQLLVQISSHTNVKLREVAVGLVAQANRPANKRTGRPPGDLGV